MMRAVFIALMLGTLAAAPARAGEWNFRVLLDGREVGQHVFSVERREGGQVVTSEARFDVRILFIPAWSYDHRAIERWEQGCLQALDSWTDVNGERTSVQARTSGERLTVARPEGRDEHGGCIMSFAYWDPRILEATRLLNSQTGELMPVEIRPQGVESVEVLGRPLEAERHRIAGEDLQIDLWYADGRWVALEALAEGGRVLRYELAGERSS
jgi:hypothetical protein